MSGDWEEKRQAQEYLTLLVLGAAPDKIISMLHLEKEVFLLWDFHPMVKELMHFIAHYRGPYAREITNIIKSPTFIENCWEYIPPKKGDDLSGGFVRLTEEGVKAYEKYYQQMVEIAELRSLLAGIKIVRTVYDDIPLEELLLLIYDTYPEYTSKSEVAQKLYDKRELLADRLLKKGVVSEHRAEYLKKGEWRK